MTTTQLEIHPAAEIFPMMSGDDFRELVEDIRENGLREQIIFYQGKLLDGRNRLAAMEQLGIDYTEHSCEIDESDDFDPVAFVLSLNLHRRHLSTSQRAMIAGRFKKVHEVEAKKRQQGGQGGVLLPANLPEATKGDSRDQAGNALKVSGKSVDAAVKILESGNEELIKACDEGRITVNAAMGQIEPEKKKPKAKPQPAKPPKKNDGEFQSVKAYIRSLDAADRGCINDFCLTLRESGVKGDAMMTLISCVIDWTNH
jgi:hypothetical protein